jgi:hypothetical protein
MYTVPQEQDINVYVLRLIDTISSIKDKTSKDNALLRMENMVSDIQIVIGTITPS